MLLAGVFGYWAGFNLSTPGDEVALSLSAAAAVPASAKAIGDPGADTPQAKLGERYLTASPLKPGGHRAPASNRAF